MFKSTSPAAAVVFDCDGTLVSTQSSILLAAREFLHAELGRTVSAQEVNEAYTSDMKAFARHFGLDFSGPEQAQRLLERWSHTLQQFKDPVHAFPGIAELLTELTRQGVELYLWTARDRPSTRRILNEVGLSAFFLDMRCVDDCTPKPHPEGIAQQVDHIEDKRRVFVIGDSFTDIQGARAYGARALGAIWEGSSRPKALLEQGAEALFETPGEFLAYIARELAPKSS